MAWSTPAAADDSTAVRSSGSRGSKLKWLPYRPAEPRTSSRVVSTGHVTARRLAAWVPSPRAAAGSPFADPFGDGQWQPRPATGRQSRESQTAGPLLAGSNLQLPLEEPPVGPETDPTRPAPAQDAPPDTQTDQGEDIPRVPTLEEGWTSGLITPPKKCPSPDHKDFYTPIGQITTDTSIKPDTEGLTKVREPDECLLSKDTLDPDALRKWAPTTFTWKASGLCHKPLYFEDVQLERYGHSHGPYIQQIISGAHFFLSVPVLPYKMAACPPEECIYTLGYYRPGNCAPYMVDPVPLSLRGALAEGGAWTAAVFLIP